MHIAQEETKFGLDEGGLKELLDAMSPDLNELKNINICGLMGMASFTDDEEQIKKEFRYLKSIFDMYAQLPTANYQLSTLSMGMSADYKIAIEEGSTMVRIGSLLFIKGNYPG